ncbi:MAG: hypothetical protein V4617_03815 [Gemmatimonadota bacterium]
MQTESNVPGVLYSKWWERVKWALFLTAFGLLLFTVVSEWGNLRAEAHSLTLPVALMALNAPVRQLRFQVASLVVTFVALGLWFWFWSH